MSEPAVVYEGRYYGRLPRLNEWHGSKTIGHHSRIFENTVFKRNKADMAVGFSLTRPREPIDYPVDARIEVSLWKRIDSDAPVKGILDALELGRVIEDDKLIRHFSVIRKYHHRDSSDSVQVTLRLTGMKRGGGDEQSDGSDVQ